MNSQRQFSSTVVIIHSSEAEFPVVTTVTRKRKGQMVSALSDMWLAVRDLTVLSILLSVVPQVISQRAALHEPKEALG